MLETIDLVRWEEFTDAYGPATRVAGLLRQLASADPSESRSAAGELFGRIVHQGDTSTAAAAAAPFLVELAGVERVGDRPLVLALLHAVATCWYPFDPVAVDAHRAAAAGVPLGIELLGHGDGAVRAGAAHLLGAFPEERERIEPALRDGLRAERGAVIRAGFFLSFRSLGARDDATIALLREGFRSAASPEERWSAALALAFARGSDGGVANEEIARLLVDAYLTGEVGGPLLAPLMWDWSAEVHTEGVLAALGSELVETVVAPRLFDALARRPSLWMLGSIHQHLLCATFPKKDTADDATGWSATQRRVIAGISDDDRLWADYTAYAPVTPELERRGLVAQRRPSPAAWEPYDREGARASLRALLAQAR
ncbi:MAG: lyase [Myxococcaceae bacterium]|nr:lyase [Myxococcaceae bacterium]